jgi:hypothetical protein
MTTPTTEKIMGGMLSTLRDADLDYEIAWPGVSFTPPSSGIWLEPTFQPNTGIDSGLAPTDEVVPQGMMTVLVMSRAGSGTIGILMAAEEVKAAFPKNSVIAGMVRVQRTPTVFDIGIQDDRIGVSVTIPYSG